MKLKKSKYKGFLPVETDKWGYYSIRFQDLNMIITDDKNINQKIMPNLLQFVREIRMEENLLKGYRELIFENNSEQEIKYKHLVAKTILEEEFYLDGDIRMHRDKDLVHLYSVKDKTFSKLDCPNDQLIVSIDDKNGEYTYLNDVKMWADTFYCIDFETAETFKPAAGWPPTNKVDGIVDEFKAVMLSLKYDIEEVVLCEEGSIAGTKLRFSTSEKLVAIADMTGMLKCVSSILMLSICLQKSRIKNYTLFVDHFDEEKTGDVAAKLCEYLFDVTSKTGGQLIVISQNIELLESVDMKYWHILYNNADSIIRSKDYENSKYKFKELMSQGFENYMEVLKIK